MSGGECENRTIETERRAPPPGGCLGARRFIREVVVVHDGAQEAGRPQREGVVLQEPENRRRALENSLAEAQEPGLLTEIAERGEPPLPVHSRLMWLDKSGPPLQVARLVSEFVRKPVHAILASFENDLIP